MPKTPIDYSKTIIYKICCKDITIVDCYVGSTNDFDRRKGNHKHVCHNEDHHDHNLQVYEFIRSHGDWANWSMIPVELYKTCKNKLEKLARERYYVELLNATLNSCVPGKLLELGRTEYDAKYRTDHKEHIKKYDKKRIETKIKCKCGGKYCGTSKTMHFRTQKHQNYIQRQQLLADHDKTISNIDNIINKTSKFIKRSERFLAGLNILK